MAAPKVDSCRDHATFERRFAIRSRVSHCGATGLNSGISRQSTIAFVRELAHFAHDVLRTAFCGKAISRWHVSSRRLQTQDSTSDWPEGGPQVGVRCSASGLKGLALWSLHVSWSRCAKTAAFITALLLDADRAAAPLRDVGRWLDRPAPEAKGKKSLQDLKVTNGEISLQNVTFGCDPATPVLNNIELVAPAGQMTALVGLSGSGKSMIFNLTAILEASERPHRDRWSLTSDFAIAAKPGRAPEPRRLHVRRYHFGRIAWMRTMRRSLPRPRRLSGQAHP